MAQSIPPSSHNDQLLEQVTRITEDLLRRIGVEGTVFCRDHRGDDSPHVWIQVMSEESGLLIGERGAHLRALEHVLRLLLRDVVRAYSVGGR